jgi:hypothetical protein
VRRAERAAIRAAERFREMPHLLPYAVILALPLAACGRSDPKPDAAAIDRHLNQLIEQEDAERARLVEEARAREEVRAREMKLREANYRAGNIAEPANASSNAQE